MTVDNLNNVKVQLAIVNIDTRFLRSDTNLQQAGLDTLNQSTTDAAYPFEHCIPNWTWSFYESNQRGYLVT